MSNTLQLKPQHQDSVIGQILKMKALVDYYYNKVAPNVSKMQNWKAKEYIDANSANLTELERMKNYIKQHEALFNGLLCEYDLTVTVFLAKYIKN
jgi:hypothetical protein